MPPPPPQKKQKNQNKLKHMLCYKLKHPIVRKLLVWPPICLIGLQLISVCLKKHKTEIWENIESNES